MLWLLMLLGALSPSDSLKTLSKDRRAMRQLRSFPGLKSCNRTWVLKRTNSEAELCRMGLLASAGADGRNLRKSSADYEGLAVRRGGYLVEALGHAETAAKKLTSSKRLLNQKLLKATVAIANVCPIIDALGQEAAMAPISAPKARNLSSNLAPGVTTRQATCRCINALRRVSSRVKSKKSSVLAARKAVRRSGCVAQRLEVARTTQYVAPRRSRFSDDGRADRVADKKRIAAPSRETAAMNIVERHRAEIDACAAEARKLGGTRAKRAKRMKRCICSTAKGWRFAPGGTMSLEEKAKPGTLVLHLDIGKRGRVKTCGVVIKK